VKRVGYSENPYNIQDIPVPQGWKIHFDIDAVARRAQILIDRNGKKAQVKLDKDVFLSKEVPQGVKAFIIYHEIGHIYFKEKEELADKYAFYMALRNGVSPFLCYVAIRAFMPSHYDYRVIEMGKNLLLNNHLKNYIDYEKL
jgi:hypothetical protein